jgi:hypothetical protein
VKFFSKEKPHTADLLKNDQGTDLVAGRVLRPARHRARLFSGGLFISISAWRFFPETTGRLPYSSWSFAFAI